MKALVAGATGGTGSRIVKELVDRNISVRALVRDEKTAKELLPPEAELVFGDVLQPETLEKAIEGCDVLLSATGARPSFNPTGPLMVDYVGTKNLINVAKAKGINQFVMVSSMCVSKFFHPLNLFWLVLYWKKQAEGYVQQSGVPYTIVRPGGLRNDEKPGGLVMEPADTMFEGSIPRTKVAQVCVEALFQAEAKNKIVEVITKEEVEDVAIQEQFASIS
ncbi:NAD-dependent epimerase/dehydratase [Thalassoporum mexicanum PCC 7367]|uniref:SDR family oxidoreductase n=1 Tax=Thalassoporum mexicanum TaxID=3457544 RepID=UPI00029FBF50|nr:SDR family oxidoreductase [Pseudanabaena sp. PCC 7367]AFY69834.1 NAD-dependent epimerase/dehydratase [Pseudanabaena sp. PCC 7367]